MPPESPKTSLGEGIFLRPTEEEAEVIWEAVKVAGFEENGEGVLGLLLLLIEEGGESVLKNPLFRYLKANPREAAEVGQMAAQAARSMLQRFFRPE